MDLGSLKVAFWRKKYSRKFTGLPETPHPFSRECRQTCLSWTTYKNQNQKSGSVKVRVITHSQISSSDETKFFRSEKEFKVCLRNFKKTPEFKGNKKFISHFKDILKRKEYWATYYRIANFLPTNNVNTTNHVENSFR